jgi:hypothetical protein
VRTVDLEPDASWRPDVDAPPISDVRHDREPEPPGEASILRRDHTRPRGARALIDRDVDEVVNDVDGQADPRASGQSRMDDDVADELGGRQPDAVRGLLADGGRQPTVELLACGGRRVDRRDE